MKKTTTIAAVFVAALLSAAPFIASADDDYWEENRYQQRGNAKSTNAELKQYSTDEMRIMAYGQALRRFGPGVVVSVNETEDGTYLVQLRDAEQNLIREQVFNNYGAPIRGSHRD